VQFEEFCGRGRCVADRERDPQRDGKDYHVTREKNDVLPLGDQRHIGYHYTKLAMKQAPDLSKSEAIRDKSQSPWGARKKVLYLITKATYGGAQRYVFDLATHLPREKFEPIVAFGERGKLVEMLESANIPTKHIPFLGRDIALISDIASFFQILVLFWRVRPDVVHLNSSKAASLGALAARILLVPQIIFTVHGWPFKEERGLLIRKLIYFLSWHTAILSHVTIVVSKIDETLGKQMWRLSKKITYIPIGIQKPDFVSRNEAWEFIKGHTILQEAREGWPRFVTIAELTRNKGLRYAVEAAAELKSQGIEFVHIVFGDGELRADLEKTIREFDVVDRVFLAGFIPEASTYLPAFDLFILPSIKEGMPYVLLEAVAAGLPIVTTTAVNPEFVEQAQHVRAVSPADPQALAEAIIETMRDRSETELFPAKAQYPLDEMIEKTVMLYRTAPRLRGQEAGR